MRVFLAGAGGAIGRRLVPQLVARGHEVTAMMRTPARADEIRRLGARPVVADGLDPIAVGEAVARAEPDAIIHQMTALSGKADLRRFDRWFAATNELRTAGTDHLLAAAKATGAIRFIAQSYTGWTNPRTGSWVKTEDDPLDDKPAKAQAKTLAAIRYLEQAVLAAPMAGVVLRYGNFYGPGGSESMVALLRKRQFPVIGDGAGVWSWTHLDDAAAAAVAALEQDNPGIYHIVDDEPAPVAEWLPYLASAVGAPRPLRVPGWLGRLAAGEAATQWMTAGRGSSNVKAKQMLGWQPRWASWRDGFSRGLTDG